MTTESRTSYFTSALAPSPRNTRQHDKASIQELTASILQTGILQPIVARPNPARDQNGKDAPPFEIVCGHRRWLAAQAAGLEQVPVILMDLDDEQADVVRITENIQRADLHPLDEAEAFAQMARDSKAPLTTAQVATMVAKSTTYVAQRMRLVDLTAATKKAMRQGAVSLGVALQLARIPNPATRKDVEREVLKHHDLKSLTADEVVGWIAQRVMHDLSSAPFDTGDASLHPAAGACGDCPKRTGNDLVLFPDFKNAAVCTDGECYAVKVKAGFQRAAEEAQAKGVKVLSEKENARSFKYGHLDFDSPYVEGGSICHLDDKGRTWRKLVDAIKAEVPVVVAQRPDGSAVTLLDKKAACEAFVKAGLFGKRAVASGSPGLSPKQKADQRRQRIEADARREGIRAAMAELVERVDKGNDLAGWDVMLDSALHGGWHDTLVEVMKRRGWDKAEAKDRVGGWNTGDVIRKKAAAMTPRERRALAIEIGVTRNADGWQGRFGESFTMACKLYDVNPGAHVKRILKEKLKAAAAQPAKKAKRAKKQ